MNEKNLDIFRCLTQELLRFRTVAESLIDHGDCMDRIEEVVKNIAADLAYYLMEENDPEGS